MFRLQLVWPQKHLINSINLWFYLAHVNACTCECMHMSMHAHVNACTCECMHMSMHAHVNACTCTFYLCNVFTSFITEKDRCHPNPCLHDGMCMEINDELGFLCNCTSGYRGTHCQGASNIKCLLYSFSIKY